ncbi:type II toxin-antitoxin system HigB family toxin [Algoriphagus antarcticus]|uniref:mRNA interferase HigB n=1 Tax=Algoriphagus antarcticus TaxID=238540 RepID=A0A3E0D9Z4_9BACT|nr:type II toxin-antitoxin system HigB family toxin [Algoriphagus antarcticus]REG79489.1 mRNA interferase HigB [Algoriphagus antarcticus]
MKNIISIKNLIQFYQKPPNSKSSLETWMSITKHANWLKPSDVVEDFPDADPVKNSRVVFNIARNKYRLIVQISFPRQWVFIKFIGTHSEYDKVDVNTIDQF